MRVDEERTETYDDADDNLVVDDPEDGHLSLWGGQDWGYGKRRE